MVELRITGENQIIRSRRDQIRKRKADNTPMPNDLVEEILERLPVSSLVRFQFVSREWGWIMNSGDFAKRHMLRQKSQDPKILVISNSLDNLFDVFLFDSHSESVLSLKTVSLMESAGSVVEQNLRYIFPETYEGRLRVSESCDGLICLYGKTTPVYVLNPAVSGCVLKLPWSRIQLALRRSKLNDVQLEILLFTPQLEFGKDIVTATYKAVWLYNYMNEYKCEVIDLFGTNTWRYVTPPRERFYCVLEERPAFSNGSIYWLAIKCNAGLQLINSEVLAFDLHTEKFGAIRNPVGHAQHDRVSMCSLNDRLCISEMKADHSTQDIWVMNSNNTNAWEKMFSINIPSSWFGQFPRAITPLFVSKEKKILLSNSWGTDLVLYDPATSSYAPFLKGRPGAVVSYFQSFSNVKLTVEFADLRSVSSNRERENMSMNR